jgi:hypothetical protein
MPPALGEPRSDAASTAQVRRPAQNQVRVPDGTGSAMDDASIARLVAPRADWGTLRDRRNRCRAIRRAADFASSPIERCAGSVTHRCPETSSIRDRLADCTNSPRKGISLPVTPQKNTEISLERVIYGAAEIDLRRDLRQGFPRQGHLCVLRSAMGSGLGQLWAATPTQHDLHRLVLGSSNPSSPQRLGPRARPYSRPSPRSSR